MSGTALTGLLRRASDWLVEPLDAAPDADVLVVPAERAEVAPPRRRPLAAVVGLSRRCGATTIARALAIELAARELGAAVVASPQTPAVVALGTSSAAARLAETLPSPTPVRAAGRLCLTVYEDPADLGATTRAIAPAVIEVEPGVAAVEAAPVVDRVVLVAPLSLDPRLAAAVAETVGAVAADPVIVVNRCDDPGPWSLAADLLVPESRVGARFALAGRDPRSWLGDSVKRLADMCAAS